MKILAVTHKYPPSVGGMQKQSYELINGLASQVDVITIKYVSKYPKIFFFITIIPRVFWALMKHRDIKIIHANDGLMAVFLTPFLLFKNKKLTVTIHGLDIVFPFTLYQWWVRNVLARFDLIITVSNETKSECIKRSISDAKVIFIPNGFDPIQIGNLAEHVTIQDVIPPNKKILLSVGRPVRRKGFSWFALQVVPKLHHDVLYVIVGPREKHLKLIGILDQFLPKALFNLLCLLLGFSLDEYEIDKALANDNLKGKILFLGKLPQTDLDWLRKNATLYIMPNIPVKGDYEGFGLVALEAVSAGLLCIAADTDGIPSAIADGKNGILLESGNADVWISKLNHLLHDEEQMNNLAKTYLENLNETAITWHEMAERYRKAFTELLA